MTTIDPDLLRAYRDADYVIFNEAEELIVHIDESNLPVDELLRQLDVRSAAIITAWNPRSQVCPDAENQAAHEQLESAVARLRLTALPAEGRDPTGAWTPEQSLFITGIQRHQATALAARFGQNAYVWLERRRPAELVVLEQPENAWEAMCQHASQQNLCWQIGCTTCGATELREGVHKIAQGLYPGAEGWPDSDERNRARGAPWSSEEYHRFAELVEASDIDWIRGHCSRPAWLGYIGIALMEAASHENREGRLTQAWGRQFLPRLPEHSHARRWLEELLREQVVAVGRAKRALHWSDLERFECEL